MTVGWRQKVTSVWAINNKMKRLIPGQDRVSKLETLSLLKRVLSTKKFKNKLKSLS